MAYLLGVDVGTASTRAVLYDLEGRARAAAAAPTPLDERGHGQATRDPEALYQTVIGVIRQAAAQAADPAQVLGLSISSMGEAGVPLDEQDRAVYPIIEWHDTRTLGYLSWWQAHLGEERLFALTGLQPEHIYSLNKIMWLRDHEGPAYQRLRRWLSVSDYVAYRLSGVAAMSYPQACRTMAFDLQALNWSAEILDAAGIAAGIFPPAIPSGQPLGPLRGEAAAACGLSPRTLVAAGGHDHICAAVAAGVVAPAAVLDSLGAVEALLAVLRRPQVDRVVWKLGLSCGAHAAPGRYYLLGGVLGVGPLLTWLVQNLLGLAPTEEGYRALFEMAKAQPRGAHGLYLVPHLAGAGSPRLAPLAGGAYVGLRPQHTRADMVRAAFEGLSYELRRLLESMEAVSAGHDSVLRAVGGGARSAFWLQLHADVTGHTVEVPQGAERGALGAALLAGLGAGIYADIEAAATRTYRVARSYQPDADAHHDYTLRYEHSYRRLSQVALSL